MVKILVQITSAGVDPWRDIEESGQMKTFATPDASNFLEYLWVEGNAVTARTLPTLIFNFIYKLYHESLWWPLVRINTRKIPGVGRLYWLVNSLFRPSNRWVPPKIHLLDITGQRRESLSRVRRNFFINRLALRLLTWRRGEGIWIGKRRYRLEFPNSYFLTPIRVMVTLDFLLKEFDFDYLVRTTSTSYINKDALIQLLRESPRSRFYGGEFMELAGYRFASGAFSILSRDVVAKLVSLRRFLRLDVYDDVAIGKLIADNDLADLHTAISVDVRSSKDWESSIPHEWSAAPAFRCKTERVTSESKSVVTVMEQIHSQLTKSDPQFSPSFDS
jgi:hypothetical protein